MLAGTKKNHILFYIMNRPLENIRLQLRLNELNIESMYQFFPDMRWEQLASTMLKENTVFIIDHITYDSLQGLQDPVIKQMIDSLKNHNSYFIITVNIDREEINNDIQKYEVLPDS